MDQELNVRLLNLPNWRFSGVHAWRENRDHARKYERAVRNYADSGNARKLINALARLGYDREEVLWHLERPGKIMPHEFTSPEDP